MKERFPIFIDKESIYVIAEIDSRNFDCIFSQRATVFLNLTEEEIEEMESCSDHTNQHVLAEYFKQINVTPFSGRTQFETFYNSIDRLGDFFCGCIFILDDIEKEKAKLLSRVSGVWILSKDDIDRDAECVVLDSISMDKEDIIPQREYGSSDKNGWKGLLNGREELFPSYNEIVIYDNFIKEFAPKYLKIPPYSRKNVAGRKIPYAYIGLENLLLLFSAIFPEQHSCSLKILVVLPKYTNVDYEKRLEERLKMWIEEVKCLRTYNIIVSCLLIGKVSWQTEKKEAHPLHPRVLYSNFFSIETEKGFKLFEPYPDSNIARTDGDSKNSVSIKSFFSTPKMRSNPLSSNYNIKLKDIYEQIQDIANNTILGDFLTIESFKLFDGFS